MTTEHYESFETLELCVASGGRLAKTAPAGGVGAAKYGGASSSWLGMMGGKFALIGLLLAFVFGAFWVSRGPRNRDI